MAVYPEKRKGKFTGVWIAEVFVNGQRQGRERFSTQKDAEHWHDFMKLTGAPPPEHKGREKADSGPTVARVVEEYRREFEGRDKNRLQQLRILEDVWGRATPIVKIDERYLDMLADWVKSRPGYGGRKQTSKATLNRYLSTASALLKFAKRKKYVSDLPEVAWRKEEGKRILWLDEAQEARIGAAMLAEGWTDAEVLLRVLTRTGMRWGEFEGLEPRDVAGRWVRLEKTKTDTPRDIPIVPALANELRTLVERGGIKYSTFVEQLRAAAKDAGEDTGITPHCLRHTTATRLVLKGVHLEKVRQFMGHRNIATTMKYTHVSPQHIEDLGEILSCTAGEPQNDKVILIKKPA